MLWRGCITLETGRVIAHFVEDQAPAYDIELFSYYYTFSHDSEREVLFAPLTLWQVQERVYPKELNIQGHAYGLQVIPVKAIQAPRCEHQTGDGICDQKLHPHDQLEHWIVEGCKHRRADLQLTKEGLAHFLHTEIDGIGVQDLRSLETRVQNLPVSEVHVAVECELFDLDAMKEFRDRLKAHAPPKTAKFLSEPGGFDLIEAGSP